VVSQALITRPDSEHNYPGTLGNRSIAVQFHAGSHYVALRLLEGYIPAEKIKLVHYGSPQNRFEAMWNGEVDAALVMEPWISLAEKLGCKTLCEGHYLGAENASEDMDADTFAAINRAVERAIDMLNSDKRKYLHYMIKDPRISDIIKKYGGLTPEDFHLPRLRYIKPTPYNDEIVEDTYKWMTRWGLLTDSACSTDLVENRIEAPAGASD